MSHRYYKAESRKEWYRDIAEGQQLDTVDLKLGAIMRIADATEAMAQNYTSLMADRDRYKRWYENEQKNAEHFKRANAALRGYIKRLKNGTA